MDCFKPQQEPLRESSEFSWSNFLGQSLGPEMNPKGSSPEEMHHLVEKDTEQTQHCWVHSGTLEKIRR